MSHELKVLISGSGFAGHGHADAFRGAGAEVVGIVGRTESVVSEVAAKMAIPFASTNWQEALDACRPDIVSIATPGGAHYEPSDRGHVTWPPFIFGQALQDGAAKDPGVAEQAAGNRPCAVPRGMRSERRDRALCCLVTSGRFHGGKPCP